jgi:hypothetical protein
MITMVNRLTLVLSQANRFLAFSRVILNHETDFFVIVEPIRFDEQNVATSVCLRPSKFTH